MKKRIIIFILFILLTVGASFGIKYGMEKYWADNYGGPEYYTKIEQDPVSSGYGEDGSKYWEYDQPSYNDEGDEKTVHLTEYRPKPLRKEAYLKMVVNDQKGVTSWEEVSKAQLPPKVKEILK